MVRQSHRITVVGALLIGCMVLLVVGCSGTRSEAPKEAQRGTEATEGQAHSPKAAASEEDRCGGTRTIDLAPDANVPDMSVEPGDPEARYTTNDLTGCPDGGVLSGTDESDKLAGEYGEDEVSGLGAKDTLSGGGGGDVLYGGPGNDELQAGAGLMGAEPFTERSKTALHGGAGKDFLAGAEGDDMLYGGEGDDKMLWGGGGENVLHGGDGDDHLDGMGGQGDRDKLYCGKGKDQYYADKKDYVSSSCEVKLQATF